MFALVIKTLFWSLFATCQACVEIEAEGKFGWAEKMPTWYRTTGRAGRLYGLLMGGRPLTGYHLFMFFLPIFPMHAHFTMGVPLTGHGECLVWALYFVWCVFWDYHWFVFNPEYKDKFTKEGVWWHAKGPWVLGFPIAYPIGIAISALFAWAASALANDPSLLTDHLLLIGGFLAYTVALKFVSPAYHHWYNKMRERDDRDKAGIFHDGTTPYPFVSSSSSR